MKLSTVFAGLTAASLAVAAPLATLGDSIDKRQSGAPTDLQVLQYALVLEHLENAFYSGALAKYSAADFKAAGFPDWVRARIMQISGHEGTHVKFLQAALGNNSFGPCAYAFPYTDVKSFIGLAYGLENIGVSAYAGANQYITTPAYKTAAATILTTEARHNGFLGGPVLTQDDWSGPFDTPLGLSMVYTLAAQLITSCPAGNPALPVKAYAPLTSGGSPIFGGQSGQTIKLDYMGSGSGQYAAIYNGLGSTIVPVNSGSIVLPAGLQGFSYIIITSASTVAGVTDSTIIAGPAELESFFGYVPANPGFMNPYGA